MGTRLLQRNNELAAVDQLLTTVGRGRPGCLVLKGPAGIGKTSVLDHAASVARVRGVRVRRAVGDDLEAALPFGIVRRLFDDVPIARMTDENAGVGLFPLLRSLQMVTFELVDDAPHLLLLDDVQWSDPQSLRFVNYLMNRWDDRALGIILAIRAGASQRAETTSLVVRIEASPDSVVHSLDALSRMSVTELVRAQHPSATDAFCAVIAEATGGNPFLCREMLATVRAEGIDPTDQGALRLDSLHHAGIRTSILVRLFQLGHLAPEVSAAVAVLGVSATPSRVAEILNVDEGQAAETVDRLVAAGVLSAHGSRLEFEHPIVREAVYGDIGPGRRSTIHRAAARVLIDEGAEAAEVAGHVLAADGRPEPSSVPALYTAAVAAMSQGAPERAADLLRAALEATGPSGPSGRILVELGRAEATAGRVSAVDHYRQALEALSATEGDAAVARDIGEALYGAGHHLDASRAFERGLAVLDIASDPGPGRALLEAQLLAGLYVSGLLAGLQPTRVVDRLDSLVPGAAAPALASRALLCLEAGRHAFGFGVPPEAHHRDPTVDLARAALAGDELPLELGVVVLEPLALGLYISRELSAATRLLDRLLGQASDRGVLPSYASLITVRSQVHLAAGDLRRATVDAAEAIRLSAEFPGSNVQTEMVARNVLAQTAVLSGDRAAAEGSVAVEDAQERWGGSVMFAWYLDAVGRVALDRGDADAARDAFLAAGQLFLAPGGTGGHTPWRTGAALAAHSLGDHGQAVALADEEVARAEGFGAPAPIADALRCRARLQPDVQAVETLMRALSLLTGDFALDLARTEVELGAAQRRLGRRAEAREHLRNGLDLATGAGAQPLADHAAAELAAAGARRPARPVTGPDSLTPSERRVAELAVTGLSNREIAAALFVTRKTVEVHLTACYRKLAIGSRSELAEPLESGTDSP